MIIDKARRRLVLSLREPDKVLSVIPTAKPYPYRGRQLVVVPHRHDETRVLRNLGFDAPTTMGAYYTWPGQFQPFIHQRVTAEFLSEHPRAFCLNGMGSGKTLAALWAYDYLRSIDKVRAMLVISPLSTLERVWGDEIYRSFPHLRFQVLHGVMATRVKRLQKDADIYIINHDGIKSKAMQDALKSKTDIDLICVDELAVFRNFSNDRWKALNAVVKSRAWVWGLTGTPTPNGPDDAYGQVKLICPGNVPKYYGKFREEVMRQVSTYTWVPRPNAMNRVFEVMQPGIRFAREDCVDLPPTTYQTREVALSKAQADMYQAMMNHLRAESDAGSITAANEAVKVGKLAQIACGVVYGDDGAPVTVKAEARVTVLEEIIEEALPSGSGAGGKVIVFVPYSSVLEYVRAHLARRFSVAVINGKVSKSKRDEIYRAFQQEASPQVLVAQPAAMSHGLNLTAANTVVWYAPYASADIYGQANARITRPGQKSNTLIIHIEGSGAERRIYQRLQSKGSMQGVLLDMFREETHTRDNHLTNAG